MEIEAKDSREVIDIPERCAIVLDNIETAKFYASKLKKHSHIYLINNKCEFNHSRVSIISCENIQQQSSIIYKDMFEKKLINIIALENEACLTVRNKIIDKVNLDKEFCFGRGGLYSISNFWNNLQSIINSPNLSSLKSLFKGKPIILVNSGPSLNKDIEVLKKYQNKFIIIACSTAIGALHKNGIVPHFLAVIDPFPMLKDFVLPYCTKDTILLASSVTNHELIRDYPGPIVYYYTSGGLEITGGICNDGLFKNLNIVQGLYTSATVTTAAFSLSLFMEASQIIFVGQDMCFSENNDTYADGIKGVTGNIPVEMATIDGRIVQTLTSYKEVFDYFNSAVPDAIAKGNEIINCSGGAGIHGAKVMTLQEVVDKYCNEDIIIPEIKQTKIVDELSLLIKIFSIKENIEELKLYGSLFEKYINSLFDNNINYDFIKTEIDGFFVNVKDKPGYAFGSIFIDWINYLLVSNDDKDSKIDAIKLFDDVLDQLSNLLYNQIYIMDKNNRIGIKQKRGGDNG